jgi:hypothetical protein
MMLKVWVAVGLSSMGFGLALGHACGGRYPDAPWRHDWLLEGHHADAACDGCHPASAPLGPVPSACTDCHEPDRPENHNEGIDCGICHTPFGWGDIVVDHDFFPLTSAHELTCERCHVNGTYEGLDPACASCHEDDRPANHYPGQDCGTCHEPTRWEDATYDHTFPVPHEGADQCDECHLAAPDYSNPSCIHCHEHRQSEMNDKHDEVGGYVWESSACIDCHPTGDED